MPLKHPSVACPLDLIMPGAAPSLKRFAHHSHAGQHQDGATATRAVRTMTRQEGYRPKLLGEHLSRLLLQGIRSRPAVRRVIECGLRTSDDHHQECVGADERDRRPRVTQPVHRERDQTPRPTRLAVHPHESVSMLFDATAAIAATPTTAHAVDHLMTCCVVVIAHHRGRPEKTRSSEGMGFLVQSVLGHISQVLASPRYSQRASTGTGVLRAESSIIRCGGQKNPRLGMSFAAASMIWTAVWSVSAASSGVACSVG
jgi:hypothetical protein